MTLDEQLKHLPLFPLPTTVFFPQTILPLHVFEPRYRALVKDVLESGRLIGVPLLKPGFEKNDEGAPAIHSIFGFGTLIESEKLEDGRYNILLKGMGKALLVEESLSPHGYRIASTRRLTDFDQHQNDGLKNELQRIREKFLPLHPIYPCLPPGFREALSLLQDPEVFCHTVCIHFLECCASQQKLLEFPSLQERICALEKFLSEESLRHLNCQPT